VQVVITTYEMLTSESNWFRRKFFWRVVIVDEGHRLKNEKSQLSEAIRKIPAFYRVLLTGTPLQVHLGLSIHQI
jgi:SWI/SNF-related matrix-associated actin-dependent regulator of chromatin subfamily A member 5